ncbi:MAG TPA: enolase C-terminal domain-like protein [Pseudolabrys sp.]|nr:enolase C-terminal domain-like protein [Pseudolabrys sp.]
MKTPTSAIDEVSARALHIPTDAPEADGTLSWTKTTIVLVQIGAGGKRGLGYSYTAAAAGDLVKDKLAEFLRGKDAFDIPGLWMGMLGAVRNLGSRGICASAISAVDIALWDLKARLLGVPAFKLIGAARDAVPVYGSGGFTSYSNERLQEQLGRWAHEDGCRWVKMKIGSQPDEDPSRIEAAKRAIGSATLFVDANGAYSRKQALAFAERFNDIGWFEEPVSSDDLDGLRLLRNRVPAGVEIAAGEYGYDLFYFRRMLEACAVDVLQADATRCCGITGFLRAAAIAESFSVPLSAHTAPAAHLHAACAVPHLRHLEWFHDHVRIEQAIFDGAPCLRGGVIAPDPQRPGLGLDFKAADAERLAA